MCFYGANEGIVGLHLCPHKCPLSVVVMVVCRREPEVQFWECLKNVDRTSAVIYWHRAASWSRLLDALHIDTQNMVSGTT